MKYLRKLLCGVESEPKQETELVEEIVPSAANTNAMPMKRYMKGGVNGQFQNADWSFAEISGNFSNANFSGADLRNIIIREKITLTGANLSGAIISCVHPDSATVLTKGITEALNATNNKIQLKDTIFLKPIGGPALKGTITKSTELIEIIEKTDAKNISYPNNYLEALKHWQADFITKEERNRYHAAETKLKGITKNPPVSQPTLPAPTTRFISIRDPEPRGSLEQFRVGATSAVAKVRSSLDQARRSLENPGGEPVKTIPQREDKAKGRIPL